jgi:hypothetical protein
MDINLLEVETSTKMIISTAENVIACTNFLMVHFVNAVIDEYDTRVGTVIIENQNLRLH